MKKLIFQDGEEKEFFFDKNEIKVVSPIYESKSKINPFHFEISTNKRTFMVQHNNKQEINNLHKKVQEFAQK